MIKNLIYRIRGEYTIEKLQSMGLKVGKNFDAQLGFELDPSHCWLIEIGDDVTFGPHVQVLAHDASTCKTLGYAKIGRVTIGNNVFVGAGSIILPGVKIGDNSVIGAGSIVTKDVPTNMVYAGNPAKQIMTLEEFVEKNSKLMEHAPLYGEEYTLRKNISDKKKEQQKTELADCIGFVK